MSQFPHVSQKFHLGAPWERLWKVRTADQCPTLRTLYETIGWHVILYRGWCHLWSTAKWCCTKHRKPRTAFPLETFWKLLCKHNLSSCHLAYSCIIEQSKQAWFGVESQVMSDWHKASFWSIGDRHSSLWWPTRANSILTGISKTSCVPSNCIPKSCVLSGQFYNLRILSENVVTKFVTLALDKQKQKDFHELQSSHVLHQWSSASLNARLLCLESLTDDNSKSKRCLPQEVLSRCFSWPAISTLPFPFPE